MKTQASRRAKAQIRAVQEFLREWDPIGVIASLKEAGHPPDEYDSYAPYILGMLQRGATSSELVAHLTYCRTQAMGIGGRDDDDVVIAQKILAWWASEQSASSGCA